jgi:DNA primase small subunit
MYLSGRICIPIDPARVNEFDPEKVPTVGSLLSELDSVGREARAAEDGAIGALRKPSVVRLTWHPTHQIFYLNILGWEQTSLRPYVEMLDEHSRRILQAERERKMGKTYHPKLTYST